MHYVLKYVDAYTKNLVELINIKIYTMTTHSKIRKSKYL